MKITEENRKLLFGLYPPKSFANGKFHKISAFSNMGIVDTKEGLVLFDISSKLNGPRVFKALREITEKPIKYIIFSHGHFDHCFGFSPFIEEIEKKRWEMPRVIAHENLLNRFEKYRMLDKYLNWLHDQQFGSVLGKNKQYNSAHETLNPTILLRGNENYTFKLGEYTFELYHGKGETDDQIWMFVPEEKVLFTGDFIISVFPNIGNPYKVQRYPKDWAQALEKMIEKEPEYLIPGQGPLIEGKAKIKEILSITADVLNFVHDEVVKRLNEGKWFEQIYYEMLEIFPEKYNRKILAQVYGCYRFAIHAVYRLYHGWYDTGNPTDLFPAKKSEIANEFLKICDSENYYIRAKKLFEEGRMQLALHIIDVIINTTEKISPELLINAYKLKIQILKQIEETEPSFIASNIYLNEVHKLESKLKNSVSSK
ncbi:MAG: alkyl sulfatase dimerization domain-containing protein [Candidatus Hermodarchaeota archaeon]